MSYFKLESIVAFQRIQEMILQKLSALTQSTDHFLNQIWAKNCKIHSITWLAF